MKKYKLKLHYTADELKELKGLRKDYKSPMNAIYHIIETQTNDDILKNLRKKYRILDIHKEFDFMADINNAVMGTAIFPENKYAVHDSTTNQYLYYNIKQKGLRWGQPHSGKVVTKTKDEWLAISPAYEPMLERVEDDE